MSILEKLSFSEVRQRGSHKQYKHLDGRHTTLSFHQGRDISPIILKQIIKDIGLTLAALYNGKSHEFIYPDLMIKIRASQFVNPEFLYKALISPFNRTYFQAKASGAQKSMPKITQEVVKNTLIPLPPLPEQNCIVAKLQQLMQLCDGLEQSIRQSKEQTNMLLQAALREALQPKKKGVE